MQAPDLEGTCRPRLRADATASPGSFCSGRRIMGFSVFSSRKELYSDDGEYVGGTSYSSGLFMVAGVDCVDTASMLLIDVWNLLLDFPLDGSFDIQ